MQTLLQGDELELSRVVSFPAYGPISITCGRKQQNRLEIDEVIDKTAITANLKWIDFSSCGHISYYYQIKSIDGH